ncbi:MAG: hypothetical protein ACI4AB_09580, partial [Acetatifactor sp.]
MNVKKLMTFALSALMVLSLAACGQSAPQTQPEKTTSGSNVEIPNPFTTYDTLDEAAAAVGFDISVPDMLEGFNTREILCSETGMLEVIYQNADGGKVSIRKAIGNTDISGDYNQYANESHETVSGQEVLFKGNDSKVSTAVWTNKDNTYAIFSSEGMEKDDVIALVETVNISVDSSPMIGGDPATWGPAVDGDPKPPAALEEAAPIIGGDPATWGPALEENVQIPSPFADCETLEEAIGITEFDMVVPETLEGYDRPTFQVMSGTMIQVIYRNDKEESVSIRKALGSDDISGDYNEYAQNRSVSVGELEVSMKGEQELVHLATWTDGGYTYAVSVSSGLSEAAMA